jgi:hypothetical protein
MKSATLSEFFIKETNPTINRPMADAIPTPTAVSGNGPWPVTAHRRPSIAPTMGLRQYRSFHCSGTTLVGYITGLEKNHTWVKTIMRF